MINQSLDNFRFDQCGEWPDRPPAAIPSPEVPLRECARFKAQRNPVTIIPQGYRRDP
jgi:hypothetical protein